jgi:hypothetical protein
VYAFFGSGTGLLVLFLRTAAAKKEEKSLPTGSRWFFAQGEWSMVTIPAVCLSCGALFPSRFASLFGGTNVNLTLRGNAETCPYCGRLAHVADGVFHIAGDILTVVSAPHITREMLAALSAAVRKAYQDKKPPEEVAQEVEKIDPALGAVIRKNASTPLYWLVLILILAAIKSCSVNITLDANRLIDQLQGVPPASVIEPAAPAPAPSPSPAAERPTTI